MKRFLQLCCFLFPTFAFAQNDSVKVVFSEEKIESFEKTTLLDEYEQAFGSNRTVKSALKVGGIGGTIGRSTSLFANYEQKFGKSFSTNVRWEFNSSFGRLNFIRNSYITIEPRYYFRMKKRIEEGKQANNLNGDYISLIAGFGLLYNRLTDEVLNSNFKIKANNQLGIRLGRQFGKTLDLGIEVGRQKYGLENFDTNNSTEINFEFFYLRTTNRLSIGLFFPRWDNSLKNDACEFMRCNYENKRMLKWDVNQLFGIGAYSQVLNTSLDYEFKPFKNPSFSVNMGIKQAMGRVDYNQNGLVINQSNIYTNAYAQFRYYPTMKNRIATGKSASNLNGWYVAPTLFSARNYLKNLPEDENFKQNYTITNGLGLSAGIQKRLARNTFIDVGVMGFSEDFLTVTQAKGSDRIGNQQFNIYLKVGFVR